MYECIRTQATVCSCIATYIRIYVRSYISCMHIDYSRCIHTIYACTYVRICMLCVLSIVTYVKLLLSRDKAIGNGKACMALVLPLLLFKNFLT